ncbi:MAG TPA: PilN domain-containing protein [Phycisphaerae bacterium]|nr:PilN domain-containing protein [Phycisphaerae bacterium]HRY66891.1 PilN domain-containing protein [Phycisphaerae bacterium]HSA26950.1 PilN domain-containing protein [Phycisphaerae bacterium]
MTPRVNLLPAQFRRRRRDRRRRRLWISACLVVMGAQLVVFLLMSGRIREVERQRAQAARLARLLEQEKTDRKTIQAEAAAMAREVRAAERLREKHCWSRWLGNLGLIVPDRVVLTSIQTDPPRYVDSPAFEIRAAGGKQKPAAASGVSAMRIAGNAVEHRDLLALLEAINGTRLFQTVRLEEARRGKPGQQEGVSFRVTCEW